MFSGKLGRFQGVIHDIDVGDTKPISQPYYRLGPDKMPILKEEIDKMLDLGVIRPSHSEWASPMILVKKANNEWRPCVDYRRVNAVTKGDAYPIPRLDDLIDRVASAKFITKLDLSKGYWQVPLTSKASQIAAFVTPWGLYEPLTTPFGLKLAPMTFQRAMNETLVHPQSGCRSGHFVDAYLDDVAVQSDTWQQHLEHLDWVFRQLSSRGVTLNAKKCTMGAGTVTYLGHELGSGQVCPIAAKVEAITNIPRPRTKKQLRSFLGVVGFFRRFIPHFSEMAAPLTDLLSGRKRGEIGTEWYEQHQHAFEKLKMSLTCHPILKAPNFSEPFEMYTDASDLGISAVLTQNVDETPKPVAYYSRKLLRREKNYSTIEKELLAIMSGLNEFQVYIGQGPIKIYCDHNPLVWLNRLRASNQRLLRWALCLSEYDISVQHIKGTHNLMADMLSRPFE